MTSLESQGAVVSTRVRSTEIARTLGPLRDYRVTHVIGDPVGPGAYTSELSGHELVSKLWLRPDEEALWCRDNLRISRAQSFCDLLGRRAGQKPRPLHSGVKG